MRYAFLMALPLVLLAAQPATPQAPTVVNVQLANFKFTPKSIVLDHGRPYVLRLANVADGGHDFTAVAFFAASRIAAEDRRFLDKGEVEVPPGQVREIHLTAPLATGSYNLKCTHQFHKFFGMSGKIIVR
jgi:uncharacterized cupredoxin-like copper-binding protein